MITKRDVKAILTKHPLLHDGGYGHYRRRVDGPTDEEIDQWRRRLMTDEAAENISRACEWIDSHLEKRTTINDGHTSYGLKHLMEYETRKTTGDGFYTSNGEFITALLLCGYRMGQPCYNPSFGISEKAIKRQWKVVNG